ncbi:MAG: hypothetical protein JW940_25275 [Polyangiaceae bacterium]|nr:hypothetical protein [Polyangiaceae bacterium]
MPTLDGGRRTIDTYGSIQIRGRRCDEAVECRKLRATFQYPVRVELSATSLTLSDAEAAQTYQLSEIDQVVLRDSRPDRGLVVVGVAVAAAVLVGVVTYLPFKEECRPASTDSEDAAMMMPVPCSGLLAASLVGAAAGGVSVAITVPLTRPLGHAE